MAKKILALLAALALLLAFTACNKTETPTDPSETATTTADDLTVNASELDTTQEGDTTDESGETTDEVEATLVEEGSTLPGETTNVGDTTATTKPATKPEGKQEIIDYFNAAMKKTKADKPGYTFRERTVIDDTKISSSKGWINTIAPGIVRLAKGLFSNWTDPDVKAKGADHSGLPPYADVKPEWIKSATCVESGGNYVVRLNLVNESVPVLPHDNKNTIHGKVLDRGVYNWDAVMGGVEEMGGIEISEFACEYSGSYVEATFNKATGAAVKVTTWTSCQASVIAKVPVFGELDASVPLGNESEYIF